MNGLEWVDAVIANGRITGLRHRQKLIRTRRRAAPIRPNCFWRSIPVTYSGRERYIGRLHGGGMPYTLRRNFRRGDLLYGREEDRARYRALVSQTGGYYITIDRYNSEMLEPQLGWDGTYTPLDHDGRAALSRQAREFSDFLLAHPRYAPSIGGGRGDDEEPKIRRACKAGIAYVVSQQGRRLHFLLDGLNLTWIITKTNNDPGYTGSELRYIYRNWNHPNFQRRIWFYRHGNQVPAPWVTDPHGWTAYHPTHLGRT